MRLCVFFFFLFPSFYLKSQTTTKSILKLSYQDSEAKSFIKQARFSISQKSEKGVSISLLGKTIFLYANSSCSGDVIGKQENSSTDIVNFHIYKKHFEANKTYYLSAGVMTKDNSKLGYKLALCSHSLTFKTTSYTSLVDPTSSPSDNGLRSSSRTTSPIRIEFIEALNVEAPSIRAWNITNSQERIRIFSNVDCTGDELSVFFSKSSLKSSKDLHLSASQFSENKTYILSAKTDQSTCSNNLQYIKNPTLSPQITFLMTGPKKSNVPQISFEIINLKKGDIVTVYQDDNTCTNNLIKQTVSENNRLNINGSLLEGINSENKTYQFYAQAKRGNALGTCLGPRDFEFHKNPPETATLSLVQGATTTILSTTSFNRTPEFNITNLAVGNYVDLILGANCLGSTLHRLKKNNDLAADRIKVNHRDLLRADTLYVFSAKVTDPMGNSSCSNNFTYTLKTEIPNPTIQLILNGLTQTMKEASPTFKVSNISTGDKVVIYKDSLCTKIASEEKVIGENQKTIEITITKLKNSEKNNYHAGVLSKTVQGLKCSSVGIPYQYKPTPVATPGIDPIYVYEEGSGSGSGEDITSPPDPRVDDENARILALGSNLAVQPVTNFYVTELAFSEKEVLARTSAIKTILDSDEYKDAAEDKKPWLNTDQLVPYVKIKDNTFLSIGAHTVSRILYNLQTLYPQAYPNLKTYSRIVRDYSELNFTDDEIKKDIINSGFVWLHNLAKTQTIITNQYVVNPSTNIGEYFEKLNVATAKINTTAFCDTSIRDLISSTSGGTINYFCSEPFIPSKLFTETYSNVLSKKIKDMVSDPYLSLIYYLKNGLNPYDSTQKDLKIAPFDRLGISSFSSDPQALENTITEYVENLITKPEYLYQDNKWALYIRYRLQRDFGLTYSQIKNSYDTFKPSDPSFLNNKEFGRNVCRALVISRGQETINLASKNPKWFPGYKWNSSSELPDLPPWCSIYGDTLYSNITIMKTVSY
jgi:hypothetical protein